jgi:hypothetical protein
MWCQPYKYDDSIVFSDINININNFQVCSWITTIDSYTNTLEHHHHDRSMLDNEHNA